MPRPKTLEPKYRLHKSSGRAYVVLDGRTVNLGEYGSAASRNRYHTALSEWLARGRTSIATAESVAALDSGVPSAGPTVSMLLAAFWSHAKGYYRNADGTPAGELENFRLAMRPLKAMYGATAAAEFSPLKLKAVRAGMVAPRSEVDPLTGQATHRPGWSRTYANRQVGRIKAIFKWAVENELVPPAVYQGLSSVSGLRKGRSEARETEPVTPAPEEQIQAVLDRVSPQVRAMIELQLLTGARPGELCRMRTCDVDTTQRPWVYRPAGHKTSHHGHRREIFIGPRAERILAPLLKPDLQAYVFSPADAERDRAARRRAIRQTPVQPSQRRREEAARRRSRARRPGDRYDVESYRRAIARACAAAYPPPAPLARRDGETLTQWKGRLTAGQREELRRWRRSLTWHPHQLRHNAATRLRREFGLEAAQVILGHKTLAVTEIYAEKNVAKARQIMTEVG